MSGPQLVMVIEPESKHRFRYESEGGSHGVLTGRQKKKGKTYPTVKLINYYGPSDDIFIRVSIWTEERKEHDVMYFKEKKSGEHKLFIDEDLKDDYTAICKNLSIWSKKKEKVYSVLLERRLKSLGERLSPSAKLKFEESNSDDIKKEAREISNSLVLHFDAFEKIRPTVQICPTLCSAPICNQKAACKGDLKIHRLSKVSGSWKGKEDVILLCNKIQKDNVKVLFYEIDGQWKAYAPFNKADVHYQVAICFKTPAYKENTEKIVAVCLERQDERSDPVKFKYIAEDCPSKKRKKCVPEQTVNILTASMDISPPSSSNSALSNYISLENRELLQSFQEMLTKQDVSNSDSSSDIPLSLIMNADTLPDFILKEEDLADLETHNGINDQVFNHSGHNFDGLISYDNSNWFLPSDSIEMDCVKAEGQMAVLSIVDSDAFTSKPEPLKESNKMQEKQLEKILHTVSTRRDNFGNSLLHLAILHPKHITLARYLDQLAKPGIINCQNFNKQTALHIAVEKNMFAVESLLKNGSNPNIKNFEGNNCYHIAAKNNFHQVMLDLLRHSKFPPNLNEPNYDGLTPLHFAIKKNSTDCFNLLKRTNMVDFGFKEQKCGRSFLHYAVEFQPALIFPILQEEKIDVNIQDFAGNTPLHIACGVENYDAVSQLLSAGADPSIKNFKQSLEEENNDDDDDDDDDDEAPYGQIPADLTINKRILKLLEQALEKYSSDFDNLTSNAGNESIDTSEALVKSLCNLLDPGMRWKDVAIYILDKKFIRSLEGSESPTRDLLHYMKKTSGDGYFEEFKAALEMAGLNDAVQIITESNLLIVL